MADWIVFSLADGAGRAETVQASSADEAVAAVLANHPGAITTAVPAAADGRHGTESKRWSHSASLLRVA